MAGLELGYPSIDMSNGRVDLFTRNRFSVDDTF